MEGGKGRRRGVHICTPQCTPAFIRKLRTSHSRGICTALDSTTGTSVTAKKGKDTLFRFFFFFARELTLTPRISLFEKYNLRLCPPPPRVLDTRLECGDEKKKKEGRKDPMSATAQERVAECDGALG